MSARDLRNEAMGPQETKESADTGAAAPLGLRIGGVVAIETASDISVAEAVEGVGSVGGGLGKGERVYAVRFVGNTGYVVTFRQIDPLYTVDLTDPARPRVLGELEISGYSAYLHPIGEDLMLGIGGTPEGIIAACALKCLGGVIQGKLWPQDDAERRRALDAGLDLDAVLTTDDLVKSDDVFFAASGITDGELMRGVQYRHGAAITHSLVMRGRSGTIRKVESEHQLEKLRAYSAINFDTAI